MSVWDDVLKLQDASYKELLETKGKWDLGQDSPLY